MIEVDVKKIRIETFLNWLTDPDDYRHLLCVLNEATDGQAGNLSISELPPILARVLKGMEEHGEDMSIAVFSMKNHLLGKEDNEP